MVRKKIPLELPFGDITDNDRRAHFKTIRLYHIYRKRENDFPPNARARALLSFVFDFLHLGMDEAADLLMVEIDEVCPGYFDGPCKEDMEDPRFEKMCLKIADFYDKLLRRS